MDYTVLQHVGIVRVAAVKTKTTQRMFQKVPANKMTKEISLTFVICLILKVHSLISLKLEISHRVNHEKHLSNNIPASFS